MRTPMMIAVLMMAGMAARAQDKDHVTPPGPVKAAFTQQFPNAEGAKWEMEDSDEYEANFKQAGVKYSAKYAASGKWMETEHEVKKDALPEQIRSAIAATYAGYEVEGVEHVETPEGVFYEVDLEKGEQEMEVLFSADGKVVKSQVEDEDGDEDED